MPGVLFKLKKKSLFLQNGEPGCHKLVAQRPIRSSLMLN